MTTRAQTIVHESTLTCPRCGHRQTEAMPDTACIWFWSCPACGTRLQPKPGDCCVFCSYGTAACPSRQQGAHDGAGDG